MHLLLIWLNLTVVVYELSFKTGKVPLEILKLIRFIFNKYKVRKLYKSLIHVFIVLVKYQALESLKF